MGRPSRRALIRRHHLIKEDNPKSSGVVTLMSRSACASRTCHTNNSSEGHYHWRRTEQSNAFSTKKALVSLPRKKASSISSTGRPAPARPSTSCGKARPSRSLSSRVRRAPGPRTSTCGDGRTSTHALAVMRVGRRVRQSPPSSVPLCPRQPHAERERLSCDRRRPGDGSRA